MKILITGAGGQLGRALAGAFLPEYAVLAYPHAALDVTDSRAVRAAMRAARPDAVIHAAAWTDVDGCERDPERAMRVNTAGTRNVARALPKGAVFVYVSTDFVFNGKKRTPYAETDKAAPLNAYGRSKLAGEREALRRKNVYVVRTSWLYGPHGGHFASTILGKALRGERNLRVVRDQTGAPTLTLDLARQIRAMLEAGVPFGVYHAANAGACSRAEFAKAVLREYHVTGVRVSGVPSGAVPGPVKRPRNSRLSCEKLRRAGVPPLRGWKAALRHYVRLTGWQAAG
jgi:dTDP-4-dehydrorhamnose reductase